MQATDYQKQAQGFLDKYAIKFRATLSDSKSVPWKASERVGSEPHHFRVTLSRPPQGRNKPQFSTRITFDFWGSIADAEKGITTVTPYDVLACISGDVHAPETFKDFCAEFGESGDSIRALQTFRRVNSFGKRLRAFFTKDEIEALSEIR